MKTDINDCKASGGGAAQRSALLGARPNVALAISTSEWSERYRRALRQLCKTADDEALNLDNSIAMQSRMMGESPEATARCVSDEIEAWSNESAPND